MSTLVCVRACVWEEEEDQRCDLGVQSNGGGLKQEGGYATKPKHHGREREFVWCKGYPRWMPWNAARTGSNVRPVCPAFSRTRFPFFSSEIYLPDTSFLMRFGVRNEQPSSLTILLQLYNPWLVGVESIKGKGRVIREGESDRSQRAVVNVKGWCAGGPFVRT